MFNKPAGFFRVMSDGEHYAKIINTVIKLCTKNVTWREKDREIYCLLLFCSSIHPCRLRA